MSAARADFSKKNLFFSKEKKARILNSFFDIKISLFDYIFNRINILFFSINLSQLIS